MARHLLEAVGLGFSYDRPVLSGLDLVVDPGEVAVLVGLNGAGKTTALRLFSGQIAPAEGRVRVCSGDPLRPAVRRRLGYVPEVSDVPAHLPAREVVAFAPRLHGGTHPGSKRVQEMLERVGLGEQARRRPGSLSKGMLRRLELACMLAVDPALWILDEPRSGLDPMGLRLLREILLEARDRGRGVVLSTHDLVDVRDLADQVLVLRDGRPLFAGAPEELAQRTGLREFVIEGGDEEAPALLRRTAEKAGCGLRGPRLPVEALEAILTERAGT